MPIIDQVSGALVRVFTGLFLCFVLDAGLQHTTYAQDNANDFQTIKSEVRALWGKGDLAKAADLLKKNEANFTTPADRHTVLFYLSMLYLDLDNPTESIKALNRGFSEKFFFSFGKNYERKLAASTAGKKALAKNEILRAAFFLTSEPAFHVILPEHYVRERKYPILYFFHGNNSNLEYLREEWKDVAPQRNFIVVLAQSAYARSNFAFDWLDEESGFEAFRKMHNKVEVSYSIDKSKTVVGGFSNGGRFAISLVKNRVNSMNSFIAFSPSMPKDMESFEPGQNPKGAIITGERDYLLKDQIEIAHILQSKSFPLRLVVLPDHNHDYPPKFGELLNTSIEFVSK